MFISCYNIYGDLFMITAIITGASSGLGTEFAKEINKKYPQIESFWLIARRKEKLQELARELGEDKCFILPLDLTEDDAFLSLEQMLKDAKPEVEFLINNAGFGKMGDFSEVATYQSVDQIKLNCIGLTATAGAVLPYMQKNSKIINISSIASFAPNTRLTVYSSTKAYVTSFSKGLREELKKRKIKVTAVCPGPMDTEFLAVANIPKGSSFTFDTLPRVKPQKVAKGAIKAAEKNKAIYTPGVFYKFYRVLAKVLPHSLVMKLSKV